MRKIAAARISTIAGRDAEGGSPPACMGRPDDPADPIHKENGHTVRRPDPEGRPRPVADQAVAFGTALPERGRRRRGLGSGRRGPVSSGSAVRAEFRRPLRPGSGSGGHPPAGLPTRNPEVEAGIRPRAHAAVPRAEGVGHETQRRELLGFKIFDGLPACETEHGLTFSLLPEKGAETGHILRQGR